MDINKLIAIREGAKKTTIKRIKENGYNAFIVEEEYNRAFDKVAEVLNEVQRMERS